MPTYSPPLQDMQFVIEDLLGFTHEALDSETITAILEEASKLASEELAPLNQVGDKHGAKFEPETGRVTTAPGFKNAYKAYCEGGWNALPFSAEYGGQALPWSIAFPVQEMWQGANMSFGLCPLLNQGAVEAIAQHGNDFLKETYLEKLISGEWTGTMNLTEPQAGSDLGLLKTKAELNRDETYRISGQKIFITYGEHDLTDNIIHLVLARLPDAPDGVKGISLFVVPKILPDGARNSVKCIGLEHKLGIHASPTCTMEFDEAIGYLVGEAHNGLKYMFTMMNNARLSVGLQGVAIAQRAYEAAFAYASDRIQGKNFTDGQHCTIDQHPDVQRMLLTMQAKIEAGRALTYQAAKALDDKNTALVDLLTPLVKSWCTDMAVDVASMGLQIHGGMGFIEETGAAQFYRDARILPIYEGTNGIQAQDLIFRKILRDEGAVAFAYLDDLKTHIAPDHAQALKPRFDALVVKIKEICVRKSDPETLAFMSASFLNEFAELAGAALLSQSCVKVLAHPDPAFGEGKVKVADFCIVEGCV